MGYVQMSLLPNIDNIYKNWSIIVYINNAALLYYMEIKKTAIPKYLNCKMIKNKLRMINKDMTAGGTGWSGISEKNY